ncbi:helix-turn-helix domain-containing protein [Anaerostipes rhamnosivorans]|jgi:putative transcriptional regulator|nr:XRE family transcriptional regulator [Anaerostipes rhamnosivorans]
MSNTSLQQGAVFSANMVTWLKCIEDISFDSKENNCHFLKCSVDDILEFIPDEDGGKEND